MRLTIAFRNILRNKRRTLVSVAMIASGICAIILFRGFSDRLLLDLQEAAIRTQGHLQVAGEFYWDRDPSKGAGSVLLKSFREATDTIKSVPEVAYVSGRSSFYGLISTGEQSLSAKAWSFDPEIEHRFMNRVRMVAGEKLANNTDPKLIIGAGLQKQLKVKPGDNITVVAYTYDGVVNAMDFEMAGIFQTGVSEVDNNTFMIPLSAAKTILDTDYVENLVIGLNDTAHVPAVKAKLNELLPPLDSSIRIKDWVELADFYRQVLGFYKIQNLIIELIIFSIVFLGIFNTVSMSIYERIGEIGTLLAIGEKPRSLLQQFLMEGAILGTLGSIGGVILGVAMANFITALNIPMSIPGASMPLQVRIALSVIPFLEAFALSMITAVVAAVIPAYQSSKMNIVEALKRNI